jgi:hypothetical protein
MMYMHPIMMYLHGHGVHFSLTARPKRQLGYQSNIGDGYVQSSQLSRTMPHGLVRLMRTESTYSQAGFFSAIGTDQVEFEQIMRNRTVHTGAVQRQMQPCMNTSSSAPIDVKRSSN